MTTKCSETTCDGNEILRETRLVKVLRFTDEQVEREAEAVEMVIAA